MKKGAMTFLLVLIISILIIYLNKFTTTSEVLSHSIVKVVNVKLIDNGYMYFNGYTTMYIPDEDWDLTFNNTEIYRELSDARPSIGDLYNRDLVKYTTIKKETQEIVKTKVKIEYKPVGDYLKNE